MLHVLLACAVLRTKEQQCMRRCSWQVQCTAPWSRGSKVVMQYGLKGASSPHHVVAARESACTLRSIDDCRPSGGESDRDSIAAVSPSIPDCMHASRCLLYKRGIICVLYLTGGSLQPTSAGSRHGLTRIPVFRHLCWFTPAVLAYAHAAGCEQAGPCMKGSHLVSRQPEP